MEKTKKYNEETLIEEAKEIIRKGGSDEEIFDFLVKSQNLSIEEQDKMSTRVRDCHILYNTLFSDDRTRIAGRYVELKSEDGIFGKQIEISKMYEVILDMLNAGYEGYTMYKNEDDEYSMSNAIAHFMTTVIIAQRARKKYKFNNEEYKNFAEGIDKIMERLKSTVDEESVLELSDIIFSNSQNLVKHIKSSFNMNEISDSDIVYMCEHFLGKDLFKKYWNGYCSTLLDRKNIIKSLEEKGYLIPKECRNHTCGNCVLEKYKEGKKYLLKYLSTREYFNGYFEGVIKDKELARYTKIEDMLILGLSKNSILEILKKKIYNNSASYIIWEQFDKGFWTPEDIRILADLNYMRPIDIIETYRANQKRKIATALNASSSTEPEKLDEETKQTGSIVSEKFIIIRDEKIMEFFTPEFILQQELNFKLSDDLKTFYRNELKTIYINNGKDLEQDIVSCVNLQNKEQPDIKDDILISLYETGLISADKLCDSEISEEKLIKYYKDHKEEEKIFIDFYNNKLLSGDFVLEEFGENTDKLFDMIKSGLDVNAIEGWYSTKELIDYLKDGKISKSDLSKLKNDVKLEDLKRFYLIDKDLTYKELYGLVEDGVITKEDADSINEEFDLQAALDKLRAHGIKGKYVDDFANPIYTKTKLEQNTKKKKTSSKHARGLSPKLQLELFKALGGNEEVIEFNEDHPFRGCVLIPVLDKKVGIIEGDARTCVVPLKIAIEYVEHPGSVDDIFGNATCKNDIYTNKAYVSSLNHTKNWGSSLVREVGERSTVMTKEDVKKLKENVNKIKIDGKPLLDALQQSYINRRNGLEL